MSDDVELPDGTYVPIQDTVCECGHGYPRHEGEGCSAPGCPCLGFVADPVATYCS